MIKINNLVILHVPKTGGTFLRKKLRSDKHPYSSHCSYSEAYDLIKGCDVYAVKRNPLDWYISYWRYKNIHKGNVFGDDLPFDEFILKAQGCYTKTYDSICDGSVKFINYNNMAEEIISILTRHNITCKINDNIDWDTIINGTNQDVSPSLSSIELINKEL